MEGRFKFCPRCHNLLTVNDSDKLECYRFECPTCPFFANVTRRLCYIKVIKKEESEDKIEIIDAEKAQESRQRTQVICPECSHTEAYFHQMQTRSADEPMTNFYECLNKECKHNWRD